MKPARGIVIVSGSNGRIGDGVMRRFAGRVDDVVGFDREASQPAPQGCVFVSVDITSDESARGGMRTIRNHHGAHVASVIHLAAYYDFFGKPSQSPRYPDHRARLEAPILNVDCNPFAVEKSFSDTSTGRPALEIEHLLLQMPYLVVEKTLRTRGAPTRRLHEATPYSNWHGHCVEL